MNHTIPLAKDMNSHTCRSMLLAWTMHFKVLPPHPHHPQHENFDSTICLTLKLHINERWYKESYITRIKMLKKYPFCTQRVATNVSVKLMEKQCIIIKPASEAIVLLQVDSTTNAEKEKKILLTQTKKLKVNTTYFKHFIQPWSTMIAICIRIRLYH